MLCNMLLLLTKFAEANPRVADPESDWPTLMYPGEDGYEDAIAT